MGSAAYDKAKQVFGEDCYGKTIERHEIINHNQMIITFTDGTHLTVASFIRGGKPFIGTRIMTGAIEKEWRVDSA